MSFFTKSAAAFHTNYRVSYSACSLHFAELFILVTAYSLVTFLFAAYFSGQFIRGTNSS